MPLLDVTDVLADPDFSDPTLVCRRAAEDLGTNGRVAFTTIDMVFTGTPVPTKSLELKRPDGSEYASGAMTFFTTFGLSTGSAGPPATTADIVIFKGVQYTVVDVDDWPYGAGFHVATAEKKPLNA